VAIEILTYVLEPTLIVGHTRRYEYTVKFSLFADNATAIRGRARRRTIG